MRAVLFDFGLHFLFACAGHRGTAFGFGLRHLQVGLSLCRAQVRADIFTDIDIGDIDRDDLTSSAIRT
jgi:hypothetical protein